MRCEDYPFDPVPYYPALVLIRGPVDADKKAPAPDAEFGSGFFAGCEGLVLTARHNLVDLDKDQPLNWVWVCCYDQSTADWTDDRQVQIDPDLLDKETDVALLRVSGETPNVLPLSLDWQRGDDVAVIGFQPRVGQRSGSGFQPQSVSCLIPRNWPVDAQNIEDPNSSGGVAREPYLGLQFTTEALYGNQRVLRGFSGGPVIDLERGAARVIAVEKAIQPADAEILPTSPQEPSQLPGWLIRLFGAPYVLSTPIHWVKPLFAKLPAGFHPPLHSPEGEWKADRLRVFISCKMKELRIVHDFVAKALKDKGIDARLDKTDVQAGQESTAETSLPEVEAADIYAGLFWQEYSETTAEEYKYARALGKKCFIYILDEHCAREQALEDFLKAEVYDSRPGSIYQFVSNAAELGEQLAEAVMAWLVREHREMTAKILAARVSHQEIARLQAEAQRLQAGTREPLPQGTVLDYLAQQMRDWFDTVGYRFESHEIREPEYFQWIINVPVRRGFDRILVRGVEGVAGKQHVVHLRQAVAQHKTDEGWLVAVRRIGQAARAEVESQEKRNLFCYTFDELLDEKADFTRYLDWLEEEVKRRGIDQKYVNLACIKEEFDPITKDKLGEARYDERNGWIDQYIDQWLDDPAKEHISILGEFGTGKTWFTLHYAWVTLQRYRAAKKRGLERPRLPLVIPLRDYARAVSVESLFSEFFFRKYEIPLPGYSAFEQLNRMGKLLLIFDGFDEMAARVDHQKMIDNFEELRRVVVPGSKVILTCRSEYFPEAKEGWALLTPQFEVLQLEKFDDDQIRKVLSFRAAPATVERIISNQELLEMLRRPVMTDLILDALPDIDAGKPVDLARTYLYAVRRIMERDIQTKRTFTSLADKLYFLCEISWEMLSTNRPHLNYREFPDRLRQLFGEVVREEKDLDYWQFDMRSQALLTRTEEGDYFPAHRSLLEFFAAYKIVAGLGVLASDFTELAQTQSFVDPALAPREYCWSEYFHRELDESGSVKQIAPLKAFAIEALDNLGIDFVNVEKLSRNTLAFAARMVSSEPEYLDKLCNTAWEKSDNLAWIALTLLPFLKYQSSETLARILIEKSEGGALRDGVAWVLGELGVRSEAVLTALERTVKLFVEGESSTPAAWWESAFALEKLSRFGPRTGRRGDGAIKFLIDHLPAGYDSAEIAREKLIQDLKAADPGKELKSTDAPQPGLNQSNIAAIVAYERDIDAEALYRQMREVVDFSADRVRRRCYYAVWLCGHLQIQESLDDIVKATKHPFGSVRNTASEALGKMGIRAPHVIAALEDRLADRYYRARYHAAWALGELMSTASLPKLDEAVKAEEVLDVRQEMIRVRKLLVGE